MYRERERLGTKHASAHAHTYARTSTCTSMHPRCRTRISTSPSGAPSRRMGAGVSTNINLKPYAADLLKPVDASDFDGASDAELQAEVIRGRKELAKLNPKSVDITLSDICAGREQAEAREACLEEIRHMRKLLHLQSQAQVREQRRQRLLKLWAR